LCSFIIFGNSQALFIIHKVLSMEKIGLSMLEF